MTATIGVDAAQAIAVGFPQQQHPARGEDELDRIVGDQHHRGKPFGQAIHEQALRMTSAFLRRQGRYANALPPDFVILDLDMPKMDGCGVLAEVKADPLLRNIPIVMFSTSDSRQDVLRCYELGANCYVSKPGNLQDYASAVTSIVNFWLSVARLPRKEER